MGVFEVDAILQVRNSMHPEISLTCQYQMLYIVAIGTGISTLVCIFIWRGSSTSKLQGDINKTLESFATLLNMISKTFLLELVHSLMV